MINVYIFSKDSINKLALNSKNYKEKSKPKVSRNKKITEVKAETNEI